MAFMYILTVIVVLLCLYSIHTLSYWKNRNVPYAQPLPFFGNIFDGVFLRASWGDIFHKLYNQSKDEVYGIYLLHKPALILKNLETIKRILITDSQYFCDRLLVNNKRDDPIASYVLLFLKNPEWKGIREKISPIYSAAKIKSMYPLMQNVAMEMKEYLMNLTQPEVDVKTIAVKYTVDVITTTTWGVEAHCFKDENSRFYKTAHDLVDWDNFRTAFRFRSYFMLHAFVKIFRMKLLNPECTEFLNRKFWQIMNLRMKSDVRRNDLIDILIELKKSDNEFLDGDILTAQALVFFLAGFETSSSTIAFALYKLALNQEVQTKLRNEINEVANKFGGINYDSINEMTYLDLVMKETLRMFPIVPVLERKCNTRYTIRETGTVIEEGVAVFVSLLALHYNPDYFPDPETFDPERFTSENFSTIAKSAYMPFGQGLRGCIGARFGKLSVKNGLANILQNFVVEPCEATPKKIRFDPKCLVLSLSKGIPLKVRKVV